MTENMKKLLALMSENEELAKKIEAVDRSDEKAAVEALIAIASEAGIALTAEDVASENAPAELDDDELDAVAGGFKCMCVLGGGGTANEESNTCACVLGGGGTYKDGSTRLVCVLHGN